MLIFVGANFRQNARIISKEGAWCPVRNFGFAVTGNPVHLRLSDRRRDQQTSTSASLRSPPIVRSRRKIHPRGSEEIPSELISLGLTKREAEVLAWIARGKGNHEVGVILGTKRRTISKHVEHILSKLNVENRTAAAAIAFTVCSQLLDLF